MIEIPACEHTYKRPCYRTFSNGSEHYGFQCMRCGVFNAIKKDEWNRIYIKEQCGPFEESIVEEWRQQQQVRYQEAAQTNRETKLSLYYDSPEWDRKRRARLRLNRQMFNGFCEICLDAPATHCHHVSYARFGKEWLFDLACVCSSCHEDQHEHMQEKDQ